MFTSGFYAWFERPQSPRQQANVRLLKCIRNSFATSNRTYGSTRIVRVLRHGGEVCSENRVARLMQIAGIKARHKRRRMPGQRLSVSAQLTKVARISWHHLQHEPAWKLLGVGALLLRCDGEFLLNLED